MIISDEFGDGQQFDGVSESMGEGDVHVTDVRDPLAVHCVDGHLTTERQPGEDRRLGGRILSLDVSRRIALGEPECLCLGEDLVISRTVLSHGRQDEVRRSVHDPHDARDFLAGQRFAQGPDHRDDAADRGLEAKVDSMRLGKCAQTRSLRCKEGLIASHHRHPSLEGCCDELSGWLEATHELDDEIHIISANKAASVVGQEVDIKVMEARPWLGEIADGHTDEFKTRSRLFGQGVSPARIAEQLSQSSADIAAAQEGDANDRERLLRHPLRLPCRSGVAGAEVRRRVGTDRRRSRDARQLGPRHRPGRAPGVAEPCYTSRPWSTRRPQ